MISIRNSQERGHFDFGWLNTKHSFSFGEYHDEKHMGFRSLRVLNEDKVLAGKGFGNHGHRDMEILSYVLSGSLSHKDSEGNVGVIRNGDVQRMSAGTGIMHSEYNDSASESVHFLQIWIVSAKRGSKPRYEDRNFPIEKRKNRLCLIASPDEANGSLSIDQDARVYATVLDAGKEVELKVAESRGIWVQVARGEVMVGHGFMPVVNSQAQDSSQVGDGSQIEGGSKGLVGMECAGEWVSLKAGDGAALEGEHKIVIRAEETAEFLVFDLA